MVIREATTADAGAVAALEVEVYTDPWSERIIGDELAQSNRIYLVVEADDRIVGFGGVMLVLEDAHVTTLGVAEAYRRRGIASRMLLELIDRSIAAGSRNVTLEVRESNADAQALYERFGFDHVGKRHGYYRDEDALVMWALDIDGAAYQRRLDAIRHRLGEAA